MQLIKTLVKSVVTTAALLSCLGLLAPVVAIAADKNMIAKGKELAFDRKKGNCLACHVIAGGSLPGNIGPPLIAMKSRFSVKQLTEQIADANKKNPNSFMPPFGRHAILSKEEVDQVTAFIYTL